MSDCICHPYNYEWVSGPVLKPGMISAYGNTVTHVRRNANGITAVVVLDNGTSIESCPGMWVQK